MHVVAKVALPIVYAVYTGIAEAARDLALKLADKRKDERETQIMAGAMENELLATQLALGCLIDIGMNAQPGVETTSRVAAARTLAARHAIATVECAFELAGGAAFFRKAGFERLFRDVQAARFHPVREMTQKAMTGRLAFGLGIDE
jgi:acyl-CoA dehydrogenase